MRAPCLRAKRKFLRLLVRVRGSFRWGVGSGPRALDGRSGPYRGRSCRTQQGGRWINHSLYKPRTYLNLSRCVISISRPAKFIKQNVQVVSFHSMDEKKKKTLGTSIHQRLMWVFVPTHIQSAQKHTDMGQTSKHLRQSRSQGLTNVLRGKRKGKKTVVT